MRSAGLADLLDTSISVAEVGVFKTDFRVYQRVGARYGVAPGAVSFQSSNRWDIAGAVKFGFRSVWINRGKAPDEYRDIRPTATLDGLAGLISAMAFVTYGGIALMQGQTFLARFCFTLVGAIFGFLWFNVHPAELFMGDTGSLSLGATLAVVALSVVPGRLLEAAANAVLRLQ